MSEISTHPLNHLCTPFLFSMSPACKSANIQSRPPTQIIFGMFAVKRTSADLVNANPIAAFEWLIGFLRRLRLRHY